MSDAAVGVVVDLGRQQQQQQWWWVRFGCHRRMNERNGTDGRCKRFLMKRPVSYKTERIDCSWHAGMNTQLYYDWERFAYESSIFLNTEYIHGQRGNVQNVWWTIRSCSNPLTCMNSGMIFSLYLNAYRNIQSSVSIILRIAAEKIVLFY